MVSYKRKEKLHSLDSEWLPNSSHSRRKAQMSEHRLGLVMTKEVYFSGHDGNGEDLSNHMVGLYPYAEGERYTGVCGAQFDGKECEEIHISLSATEEQEEGEAVFPDEIQQEYLKHLLKRKLIVDVLVDDMSIREALWMA